MLICVDLLLRSGFRQLTPSLLTSALSRPQHRFKCCFWRLMIVANLLALRPTTRFEIALYPAFSFIYPPNPPFGISQSFCDELAYHRRLSPKFLIQPNRSFLQTRMALLAAYYYLSLLPFSGFIIAIRFCYYPEVNSGSGYIFFSWSW